MHIIAFVGETCIYDGKIAKQFVESYINNWNKTFEGQRLTVFKNKTLGKLIYCNDRDKAWYCPHIRLNV
jgi:hypothetical protein